MVVDTHEGTAERWDEVAEKDSGLHAGTHGSADSSHGGARVQKERRIRMTPNGLVRLSPTEVMILDFLERHDGKLCSKARIAAVLGRSEKTVDRLLAKLRRRGLIVSEPVYAESGAQLANVYHVVDSEQGD